jgi:hypothetical protein
MYKLEKPLYHGTSTAASLLICGSKDGFHAPIYLCESKETAIHYAKAATVFTEDFAQKRGAKLIADGYSVFTFYSIPNKDDLIVDDYNLDAEPNQYKYVKPIRGLGHYAAENFPLDVDENERLVLQCFAIGMRRTTN